MYKLNRTDPDHNNASNTKLRFFSSFVSVSRNGTVKMTLIDNISDHLKVWKIFYTEYVFDLYIYSNSRFLYSKETLLDKHFFFILLKWGENAIWMFRMSYAALQFWAYKYATVQNTQNIQTFERSHSNKKQR